jgi:hypothetical protein
MTVTLAELREARDKVAELTANNPRLQPVFDRLDREYRAMRTKPHLSPVQIIASRSREVRELA